jgi:transcription elongation factor GreA
MSGEIYITRDGYEKLIKELELLKTVKRRQIAQAIEHARSLGDISENAEYDSAKEAQAMNEHKIAELEAKLSGARIVEQHEVSTEDVRIGVKVKIKDTDFNEEFEYTLVGDAEADFDTGKISIASPVGKALLGHKPGDSVEIKVPARVLHYKILSISR